MGQTGLALGAAYPPGTSSRANARDLPRLDRILPPRSIGAEKVPRSLRSLGMTLLQRANALPLAHLVPPAPFPPLSYAFPRFLAPPQIRSHSSPNSIPTARADCGIRLVPVIPGRVLTSRQMSSLAGDRRKSTLL